VDAVLDLALGQEPAIRPTCSRAAVLRFFTPAGGGVLRAVSQVEEARRLEGVQTVVIDAPVGQPLRGITCDGARPGYVITVAENRAEAVARAERVVQTVGFHFDSAVPSAVADGVPQRGPVVSGATA
jgi:hypothetical protein